MLVLTRKPLQKIVIGGGIEIVVVEARNGRVRLGIEAPNEISVDRHEVHIAKQVTQANTAGRDQQGRHVGAKSPQMKGNPYLMFPRKANVG